MSNSFTNQVLAQLDLWRNRAVRAPGVRCLSRVLDEEVARLHATRLGLGLTRLSARQSDYLAIDPDGPYKPDSYRY